MRYKAFISYSHAADNQLAPKLQHALQQFAKPYYKRRAINVFRDESSLSSTPELWPTIQKALHESEFFILLASQESAQSAWVQKEVQEWLKIHNGSVEQLLIVLTKENIVWDATTNDFNWSQTNAVPGILKGKFKHEPFFIDLSWARTEADLSLKMSNFSGAVATLASALLGIPKDELVGEDILQHRKFRRMAGGTILLLVFLLSGAIYLICEVSKERQVAQNKTDEATLQRNNAQNQLAQNYWSAGKVALQQNNLLNHLHLVGQAISERRDDSLLKNMLLDVKPSIPIYKLNIKFDTKFTETFFIKQKNESRILTWNENSILIWDIASNKPLLNLKHEEGILGVYVSDDSTQVLYWDRDDTVWLWKLGASKAIPVAVMERGIVGATLSKDKSLILVWSRDGNVRLWDKSTGKALPHSIKHNGYVSGATLNSKENYILSWGTDRTIRTMLISGDKPRSRIMKHKETVKGAVFSEEGSRILSWSEDGTVRLWDVATGEPLTEPMIHDTGGYWNQVIGAKFNKKEDRILSWSRNGSIQLWQTQNGQPLNPPMKHEKEVSGAAFSEDEKYILSWSNDGAVKLWEARSSHEVTSLEHERAVNGASFSKDMRSILSWSDDGTVRLWKVPGGQPLAVMKHDGLVHRATFIADNNSVLSWGEDGMRLWDINKDNFLTAPIEHKIQISGATYSTNKKWLLTWNKNETCLWDAATGKSLAGVKHESAVVGASLSPSGNYALSWDKQGMRLIKNDHSKLLEIPFEPTERSHNIIGATFYEDGSRILTWNKDGEQIWDTNEGKLLGDPMSHSKSNVLDSGALINKLETKILTWSSSGITLRKSSNGDYLYSLEYVDNINGASISRDGNSKLSWNYNSIRMWKGHETIPYAKFEKDIKDMQIYEAVFNKDASHILAWGSKKAVLFETENNQSPLIMSHNGNVYGATFNKDESRILSWGEDGIRLWQTLKRRPIVMNHQGMVYGATFSDKEEFIISKGEDGVRLWQASSGQPLAKLLEHKVDFETSNLMKRERNFPDAFITKDESHILSWTPDGIKIWNIGVDADMPKELFLTQAKAITGTELDLTTLTINCLSTKEWEKLKADYLKRATIHYKECKYPEANVFRKLFPEEANKIRKL